MAGSIPQRYTEARLSVPNEFADAVCNFIIENFTSGLVLEEEDGAPETGITFYLPETFEKDYKAILEDYFAAIMPAGSPPPHLVEKHIKNVEWVEQYKQSIRPVVIAGDVIVRPPWELPPSEGRFDIIIEPKMAFGTGTHETTRTCLKAVRETVRQGDRFLDLGAGSGILSILAAKLGASYVKAVDYDLAAIDNCVENFALNQVKVQHDIALGSLEQCDTDEPYDVVVANIIKSTILPWVERLLALTKPGGTLILSGLLESDIPEISAALERAGQSFDITPDNAWQTYVIRRV